MPRLLIVSTEFPPGPGGIGTQAHQLGSRLFKEGWEIAVVTQQDYVSPKEAEDFNVRQPFPVVRLRSIPLSPLEAIYRGWKASEWVRKWKPQLLLASGERAVWLTAWLNQYFRKPWVAIGHGSEFGMQNSWQSKLTRWSFEQANAIVCVSEFTRRKMLSIGIRPNLECVILNGADAERFTAFPYQESAKIRADLGLPEGHLLLTVGSVTERKGQDVVIRALPTILIEKPHTHYIIVGLPTQMREMKNLAQELGVAEHVHFMGRVDDDRLALYINSCDIFLMTSRNLMSGDCEGYGIAVVEAALCGKPAIVSDGSGLVEAIEDEETGLTIPEDDEIACARKILDLLGNLPRMHRMGRNARERALGEQTWNHRAKEYIALLHGLLSPSLVESSGIDAEKVETFRR